MNHQEQRDSFQPIRTIWTSPRSTIRSFVDTNPKRYVYWLAITSGITTYLAASAGKGLGTFLSLQNIILLAFVFGPVIGLIRLFIGGALLRWTGSWIGGVGTTPQVRAALGWSMVPELALLVLWVIAAAMFRESFFLLATPTNAPLLSALFVMKIARMLLAAWGAYILVVCLSEVHKFSAWKAVANVLLASGVVIVPMLALAAFLLYSAGVSFG